MKTKEFIKRVEELEFIAYEDSNYWLIKNEYGSNVAHVNKTILSQMSTDYIQWDKVYNEDKEKLFDLLVEYAETPPEDREEEKKFYLKHKYFKCTNGDSRYFQIYESNGTPWLNAMYTVMGYKKQFTLKEIDEIKEKFGTDLADFELVEVEDEF